MGIKIERKAPTIWGKTNHHTGGQIIEKKNEKISRYAAVKKGIFLLFKPEKRAPDTGIIKPSKPKGGDKKNISTVKPIATEKTAQYGPSNHPITGGSTIESAKGSLPPMKLVPIGTKESTTNREEKIMATENFLTLQPIIETKYSFYLI